jgi:hypothetical protein
MNERILELARQVWPDPNTSHVNHKKFAELIVLECAELVRGVATDTMGYHTADRKIKEHFGVESGYPDSNFLCGCRCLGRAR